MKKYAFLIISLSSFLGFGQITPPPTNPTPFVKIKITGNASNPSATKISVQEANGEINYRDVNTLPLPAHHLTHETGGSDPLIGADVPVTISPATTNYTPVAATVKGQFQGVDSALGVLTSTRVISGSGISINTDSTKFDLQIVGEIVDPVTFVKIAIAKNVTGVSATYRTVQTESYIWIDATNTIVQSLTAPSPLIYDSIIGYWVLVHSNLANITLTNQFPLYADGLAVQFHQVLDYLGFTKYSGSNIDSPGTTGTRISHTGGLVLKNAGGGNSKRPVFTLTGATDAIFQMRTQTGASGANTQTLDVGNIDVGGTITALANNNRFAACKVWKFSTSVVRVQYGQYSYANYDDAIRGLQFDNYVNDGNSQRNGLHIGWIVFRRNTSWGSGGSGTDGIDYKFIDVVNGKLAGNFTSTLQASYNVSTTPQITTNATQGAVVVKRGSALDSDTTLMGQNGAGATTFSVNGNGTIFSGSETANTVASFDASKNIKSLPIATYPSLAELSYVKGVTSAIQTQIDTKANNIIAIENVSTITYSLIAADLSKRKVFTSVDPVTITVPANATTAIPIGTKIEISQQNTGALTLAGTGITFISNLPPVTVQGETRILTKTATDTWTVEGNTPSPILVEGTEYLWAFQQKVYNQLKTATGNIKVAFSGDSTTTGDGITDANYTIDKQFLTLCLQNGIQGGYPFTVSNLGHSGMATLHWDTTYADADKVLGLDLYIMRWGINDPAFLKNGSAAPIDAGANYPNRRTPSDVKASLISGLTKFRASNPYQTCSIVLMMPNSTNDAPNGRYAPYYDQLIQVYRDVARQFKCAFIDTYSYMKDVSNAAGYSMDNPFADGRAIHPKEVMTSNIAGLIFNTVMPAGIASEIGKSNFTNTGGVGEVKLVTDLPSTYGWGLTSKRADKLVSAWPLDGIIATFHNVDNTLLQFNSPYRDSDGSQLSFRAGNSTVKSGATNSWSAWQTVGTLTGKGGGTTTGLANITATANTNFSLANPTRRLALGYLGSDNGYIQSYDSTSNGAVPLDLNPYGGVVRINGAAIDVSNSGTYSPTISSLVNITSVLSTKAYYTKIGSIVTVIISIFANVSLPSVNTGFTFSLPFIKANASINNGSVSAADSVTIVRSAGISQTNTATTGTSNWTSTSANSQAVCVQLTYNVTD